ncbi:MAG: SUMF1/EgtB/PvdO family nonheme iron enzyme [Bacteroidota bacterium]
MDAKFLYLLLFVSQVGFSQGLKISEPELIFVKGGDFLMGCLRESDPECLSDEKPGTVVTLYDYWIGKFEITNAQYAEFLSEKGNETDSLKPWYIMDEYALIKQSKGGTFKSKKGVENHPVNNITWYGAKAYTEWLSRKTNKLYRLPTEAEWEFAARGGNESKGYIYAGSNDLEEVSWTFENAINSKTGWDIEEKAGTFPVGQKKPNELGIYDMTGNLSEWVVDVYDNKYTGGINPTGPKLGSYKIVRGGSWDNEDLESRNTARTRARGISSFTTNKGFRVVMEKERFLKTDTMAQKYDFNGVVMVKKRDDIIYHKSFGTVDGENGNPMTNETPFTIMSITKVFTSTIILQLMEEGKINLNHTIDKYLRDYKGPAANIVTLHQLLSHTSGIQAAEVAKENDGETPSVFANSYSTAQILDKYCSGPLIFEPGSRFDYSNADYIILGKIIEEVENNSFENVLSQRILVPLGMNESGLITNENFKKFEQEKRFPKGYSWNNEAEVMEADKDVYIQNFFSAGGMYSTVNDLSKFSDALYLNKSLLNQESMDLLLQTYPDKNEYGYGTWVRFHDRGKQVIKAANRPGRNLGINTMFSYVFEHDISIIIFLNTDRVSIDSFVSYIQKQLLE